jgi:hypothetical protein
MEISVPLGVYASAISTQSAIFHARGELLPYYNSGHPHRPIGFKARKSRTLLKQY